MTRFQLPSCVRPLIVRPGLAITRLMTVALVSAFVAAVSALASATILRPLPFPEADRLVQIFTVPSGTPDLSNATPLFPVEFVHLDHRGPSIERVAGIWAADRAVAGTGEPDSVMGGRVTATFFPLLGASLTSGRTFSDQEVRDNAPVVVLSHRLWTRMFEADANIVGATLQIDRRPHTVIGVTTSNFEPAFTRTEFWTPLRVADVTAVRATVIQTIGRLRPGVWPATANVDLRPVSDAAAAQVPDLIRGSSMAAIGLREFRFGPQRNPILMLSLIVTLLAALAMANLANLTMADLASRAPDFALRSALGGSPRAIVTAEVVPCVVLALAGAGLGLWLTATTVPAMLRLNPALATAGVTVEVGWPVACASLVAAVLTMVAAVVVPSWRMARLQVSTFGGERVTDPRAGRMRALLVAAQSAIALILLSSSAMVLQTLERTASMTPGFDAQHVLTGQLRLSETAFPDHAARVQLVRRVLERLRDTPGIISAATTLNLFSVGASFTTNVSVEDAPRPDGSAYPFQFRRVSPGYFETMRIPLLRGRTFLDTDVDARAPVAVVNQAFAQRFWPDGNPVGRRIRRGAATAPWAEIVGVVADTRDAGLAQATGPVMYTCYYQGSASATPAGLVVRTQGDPASTIRLVKEAVWSVDPAQPLSGIVVLDDFLEASLGPQRFRAWLVATSAAVGLVLAVIGMYGVTARSVAERTREVGIRIALGGVPSLERRRLVVNSLRAVGAGALGGVALSFTIDAALRHLLPELEGAHWVARAGAAAGLLVVGAVAAVVAARHTTSIEPLRALRGE